MAVRKKQSKTSVLLTILAIILVIVTLLKFDAVSNVVDPSGKLGLQNIANDAFPLVLGLMLIVIGIAAAASVWVSIAFIVVGVVMIGQRIYQIWNRNKGGSLE